MKFPLTAAFQQLSNYIESTKNDYVTYNTYRAEHLEKYQPVMEELLGVKINKWNLHDSIVKKEGLDPQTIIGCIEANSENVEITKPATTAIKQIVVEVLDIQKKLSFNQNHTEESYSEISGLNSYLSEDGHEELVKAFFKDDSVAKGVDLLQGLSEKISSTLYYADHSVICELLQYANVSEIVTIAANHHTLIGIIGVSVFLESFSTLQSSGNYVILLKKV